MRISASFRPDIFVGATVSFSLINGLLGGSGSRVQGAGCGMTGATVSIRLVTEPLTVDIKVLVVKYSP